MNNLPTRICSHCGKTKPEQSFCKARRNGVIRYWNTCCACHSKAWRVKNKERNRAYVQEYRKRHPDKKRNYRRREKKTILLDHIQQHCCKDCGNTDIRVLCFHHRDPSTKLFNVSGRLNNKPLDLLKIEAEKCDVLCLNCHAIKHCSDD